jgi:hypothetical protein
LTFKFSLNFVCFLYVYFGYMKRIAKKSVTGVIYPIYRQDAKFKVFTYLDLGKFSYIVLDPKYLGLPTNGDCQDGYLNQRVHCCIPYLKYLHSLLIYL